MNNDRRKALSNLHSKIDDLRNEVESIMNDESDAYENMPDSIKDGERGQAAELARDNLENAISSLQDALNSIEEAQA